MHAPHSIESKTDSGAMPAACCVEAESENVPLGIVTLARKVSAGGEGWNQQFCFAVNS
jgi:hypothetical protein